jgi:hypothetical protein
VLVVVAPFVFTSLRRVSVASDGGLECEGRGGAFLAASWVALSAVIGQLVTVGLVFYEAKHAQVLPLGAVIPVWLALGVALVLTAYNGVRTIMLLIAPPPPAAPPSPAPPPVPVAPQVAGFKIAAPAAKARVTVASKGWTLL